MNKFKLLAITAVAGFLFAATAPRVRAQVGVSIGVAPDCPYGYYDFEPYSCAPYGYYGPEWFTGGVFIGAGPWFHGHPDFHGHVNNHFDPHRGYHGAFPAVHEKPAHPERVPREFKGNEMRDGRGHMGGDHPRSDHPHDK
jgi:hypothetical protein